MTHSNSVANLTRPPQPPTATAASTTRGGRTARAVERLLWLVGCVLIAIALGVILRSEVRASQAANALPDMLLWSDARKASYLTALNAQPMPVLATLRAPSLGLAVPVYSSASDLNMDRGAGIIDGMSYPHEPGHIGIAGHRDGYFRVLKDIAVGETLILDTLHGEKRFRIDELLIVDATDAQLLLPTEEQTLTIVTCYPFYFVGSAPQRFLVRASPVDPAPIFQSSSTPLK